MSKNAPHPQLTPVCEPEARPKRRSFTAEYKASILAECDAASEPGQIGQILRREGLYSSHLVTWRRERAADGFNGLKPKKTGRPPKDPTVRAQEKEVERLRRENAALQEKLRRAELIVEAQKKLAALLASPSTTSESGE
jgi:transposase